MFYLLYKHQWNAKPFNFNILLLRRRDVSCSHSNRVIFTCEDNMLFSRVKISCFRAKAHLVFHWCLYNKKRYPPYFQNNTSENVKMDGNLLYILLLETWTSTTFNIILGGYLSFVSDGSQSGGTLVSPLFSGEEWKCMRFWYRIGIGHNIEIQVSINSSSTTEQLWRSAHRTNKWSFVQLSINTSRTAKVILPKFAIVGD